MQKVWFLQMVKDLSTSTMFREKVIFVTAVLKQPVRSVSLVPRSMKMLFVHCF